MSESKFKKIQQDVCYDEIEETQEPDKICPTCIPNENYIEPDWPKTQEPYFNELKCEYQVKVLVNIEGDMYHDGQDISIVTGTLLKNIIDSPYNFGVLLKTYVRPAVRKMLRFYGKLETDNIVCASPPQNPGEICKGIFGLSYEQYVTVEERFTDEPIPRVFEIIGINKDILVDNPEINNTEALELVARVQDYTFISNQRVLAVLVGIPAYRFDAVPSAPDLGSLNTSRDQVVIKPPKFMPDILSFKAVMNSFKTFQSYFYREENGKLFFQESGDPFYIKFYAEERIDKFISKLDSLLQKNNFDLRGFADTGDNSPNIAFEIEVSFDKSDELNPFIVKNVRARKINCPYIECKVGLSEFIEYSKLDQTMMGYFSNISSIAASLKSNKTPPWLDFTIENTFPQLAINYGSSENFTDDSCLAINSNDLSDFIFNETLDLFKSIEYKYNQNTCKTKEEMLANRESIQDFFSGSPESVKALDDLFKAILVKEEQLNETIKTAGQLFNPETLRQIKQNTTSALKAFFSSLSPCDFLGAFTTSIKCLSASLTLDEVYYTIIKQIISSAGEQALEIILQTLPANKQEAIRKEVEKQFKDMPFPWDEGWEGGSLGDAVDRQAKSKIEEKDEKADSALKQSSSIKKQIDQLFRELEEIELKFQQDTARKILAIKSDITSKESEVDIVDRQLFGARDTLSKALAKIQDIENNPLTNTSVVILEEAEEQLNSLYAQANAEANQARESIDRLVDLKDSLLAEIFSLEGTVTQLTENINNLPEEELGERRKQINKELEILSKKKSESDKVAEEFDGYTLFSKLSLEDQQAAIEKQKNKTINVKTTPSDKIQQGTMGKALGNVQKALTQAYIDEIMKIADISELQKAIEKIPGANLLGKLISRFKCASDPLIYPPLESFLSTLTFDPCGTEKTRFSLPSIQDIPTNFNWLEQLGEAFYLAGREILSRALVALMIKATQIIETDLCQVAGNLTRNLINDDGFDGFLRDTLCPDPKTNDQRDKLNERVLSAGGGSGRGSQAYQDLSKVLSVAATQRELKQAMVGQGDPNFLSNISSLVKTVLPQFSDIFADPQAAAQYFQTMGNILTPEQRNNIQNELQNPLEDYPVETSICLTKEQKDLWDQERASAFSDLSLGQEFVDKQDEKIKSDLADAANLLLNGPDTFLENALNDAFGRKDPDCKVNKSVLPIFSDLPQNQQQAISNSITGIFKRLERAFINDTIEWNAFSSLFGFDTPGVLSMILANRTNKELNWHLLIKNNPLLNFLFGGDEVLPETVGIQLKKYIESQNITYEIGKDIYLNYNNDKAGNDNYKSSLILNDSFNPEGKIQVADPENNIDFINDNFLNIPEEYLPNQQQISFENPFGSLTLKKMIEKIWSEFEGVTIESNSIFKGMNTDIFNKLPKTFTVRRNNEISEGFLYGNEDQPILEETDLVYVGPNGEEPYEDFFTEDDKVLGKSKTNNPRVYFLDPQRYGGTYLKPQIYISEANHKGWLQFSKIVVPNPTGCDPKNSNFLMLDTLIQQINSNKQRIQSHDSIQYDPECTVELPFDKIANSDTLATLEGIVRATIRIYLSDFLIRSFPMFANINLDIDTNYDNITLNYITEKVYRGLINEKAIFASTYEGYTYALLFLEQVTQIVHRKVRDGSMESNEEIEEVLEICNKAQEDYLAISSIDLSMIKTKNVANIAETVFQSLGEQGFQLYNDEVNNMIDIIKEGCAILSGRGDGFDLLSFFESSFFDITIISLEQARLASKIFTINSVVNDIKKLLKYVVKEELSLYTKKLRESIEPRPYIYDIRKFFIGGSHMLLGNQIEAGVYDIEVPIGGGIGNFPYGDVNNCANSDMIHPLNNSEITVERFLEIKDRGGFYLEKYIVCKTKNDPRLGIIDPINGIFSIPEFKRFLNKNRINFDQTKNISDYFGDAVINEEETEYEGTIGIKYGVRLCYIPPEGYQPFDSLVDELNGIAKAQEHRSYILNPATFQTDSGNKTLDSSRYSFPICSFEEDILDIKIKELLETNDNLNQDVKCYIDKLVKTDNFKHLVNNVLQITKLSSSYLIYSYLNFITSLGSESERDAGDDNNIIQPDKLGKLFNNSKSECRKLFVSFYKNNDRDPPNEEEDNEDIVKHAQRSITNSLKFLNVGDFSWDIKRRLKPDSPLDKDGNECENNFGSLFTKRGS